MTEAKDIEAALKLIQKFRVNLSLGKETTVADLASLAFKPESVAGRSALAFCSVLIDQEKQGAIGDRGIAQEIFITGLLFGVYLSEIGQAKFLLREKS